MEASMQPIQLNSAAKKHAESLLRRRRFKRSLNAKPIEPSRLEAYLKRQGWKDYSRWFLGVSPGIHRESPHKYLHPITCDFEHVDRALLAKIRGQTRDKPDAGSRNIYAAAGDLLRMLDAGGVKGSYQAMFEHVHKRLLGKHDPPEALPTLSRQLEKTIRQGCKKYGWTRGEKIREIAAATNMDTSTVAAIVSGGIREVSRDQIRAMSEVLQTEPNVFTEAAVEDGNIYPAAKVSCPKPMEFSAPVQIQAASDGIDGKKLPRFKMIAYNGGPMRLRGFEDPIVVDINGMHIPSKIPIHRDHDPGRIVGHGSAINANGSLHVTGIVSARNDHAREVAESGLSGFPWQASIGATMLACDPISPGRTVEVNGQKLTGPFLLATRTRLSEVSFVSMGADSSTSAAIAASKKNGVMPMSGFDKWLEDRGISRENLSDHQVNALLSDFEKMEAAAQAVQLEDAPEDVQYQSDFEQAQDNNPPQPQYYHQPAPQPGQPYQPPESLHQPYPQRTGREMVPAGNRALAAAGPRRNRDILVGDSRPAQDYNIDRMKLKSVQHFQRLEQIDRFLAHHPVLAQQAVAEEWSEDRIKLEALRANRPKGPAIHSAGSSLNEPAEVVACALVRSLGTVPARKRHPWTDEEYGYEVWYPDHVLEASQHRELRNISLHQILDRAIINDTGSGFHGNRRSNAFIQAARHSMTRLQAASGFTTLEVNQIFEDAARKLLWAGYQSVDTTWQEWCHVVNTQDFKPVHMYRLTHHGAYEAIGPTGEIKHGGFSETKYQVSVDEYAKMVGMTRRHIINDDLSAFQGMLTGLGIEGAKSIEEVAYVYMLSKLAMFYSAANGNKIDGADSALNPDGLTKAVTEFENQVDADHAPIMIEPDRILVGTNNRIDASRLFNESEMRPAADSTGGANFIRNPHVGAFRPIISPYLNNTALKQRVSVAKRGENIPGQSGTHWFMFSNPNAPQGASWMMGLLNGNRVPNLEQSDPTFNVLGLQWRAVHDFGMGVGDPKLSLYSEGN